MPPWCLRLLLWWATGTLAIIPWERAHYGGEQSPAGSRSAFYEDGPGKAMEGEKKIPKIAAVVLSWNGKEMTADCLRSLLGSSYPELEVILVDNGSRDGTVEAVSGAFAGRVKIIANGRNLGFSRGNNVGIRFALANGADYVLLLNNDTLVDKDMVSALAATLSSSSDIGIVGPKIYYVDPDNLIWSAGGEVSLWRGRAKHLGIREEDNGQYDQTKDVDYVTGCALMVRKEVIAAVGMLDPGFHAYFEDTDLCMRARKAAFRVVYEPKGKLWHRISQSSGGQLGYRKISRKFRSHLRFFYKYTKPYHWFTIPLFFVLDSMRIVALICLGRIRETGGRRV